MHHHSVEVDARSQSMPTEGEVPELHLTAQRLTGFLLGRLQEIAVDLVATEQQKSGNHQNDRQKT